MKKLLIILALIGVIVIAGYAALSGTYTTNGYFYLPGYGSYGTAEFNEYNTYMQIADTQIEANKDNFADLNTEAELESKLTDVSDVLTDNDLTNIVYCNDYDHPDDAITAISSSNKTLLVTEAETCDNNFTVPANVKVRFGRGGKWTINNGITVTFNGQIDAGLWQVFALTGTGVINFGNGSSKNIYPVWWGIDGTDDDVEIQAAIDASSVGSKIVLREGTYTIGTTIDISKNVSFECLGILDSEIGVDCIQLGSASGQFLNSFVKIQEISGTGKATAGKGIIMKNVNYSSVEFGKLVDLDIGIYFDAHGGGGAAENRINGGLITGCSKGIAFSNSANWMEGNIITATILSSDTGLEFTSGGQSSYTQFLGVVDCVGVGGSVDILDNVGLMFFTPYFYRPGSSTINSTSTIISPTGTLFNNMHWTDFDKFSFTNLIKNGSFELWSSGVDAAPDDWSVSGTIARSATKKIDTYSASLTNIVDNEGTLQTTLTDVDYYSGRQITFGAWVKTDTVSRVSLKILDNEGGGYQSSGSTYHTGDGTWQLLEVTRTLRAGLTNIILRIHITSGTVVTAYSDGGITVEGNFAPAFMKNPADSGDLSLYYLKTEIDSQGEMETIWSVTLATDTELAALTYSDVGAIQDAVNTIDSGKYVDGSIDHEHLAPDVITGLAEVTSTDLDMMIVVDQSDSWALKKVDMGEVRGAGGGYTNLTEFVAQNNWKVFYSNGSGDVQELPLGADGTFLGSNGATSAPSFQTGSDVTNWAIPQDYAESGDGTVGTPWAGDCIDDAISACPTGGTVYLRAGYYTLTGSCTVSKALNIIGEGMGRTFIITDDADGVQITASYVTLKGFTIDGDAQTDDVGGGLLSCISVGTGTTNTIIKDIEVKNAGYYGINVYRANYALLENLYAHDCFRHGISASTEDGTENRYNTYRDIYCWDNGTDGFNDRGIQTATLLQKFYNVYDNIHSWDNGNHGIAITYISGCTLTDSFASGNTGNGIHLRDCENFIVSDCLVTRNLYGARVTGATSKYVSFTNVTARNNGGGFMLTGADNTSLVNCHAYDERTVTGVDIAFVDGGAGEDTITQTAARFLEAGLSAGKVFTVSGSTSNDGDYTIISVVAGTINVATDSLIAEAAGDTVTILQAKVQTYGLTTSGTTDNIELVNCDLRGNLTGRINNGASATIKGIDVHALIEDHDFSGNWETEKVGESVVFGELLYFNWTDKEWKKTDADAAATMPGLRIALESKADGATCLMLVQGDIRDDSAFAFAGSMVYASCTPGDITSTAPSASGDQVQRVGVAAHADYFYFNPDMYMNVIP